MDEQVLADTYAKFAGGGGAAKIDVNQVLNKLPLSSLSLSPLSLSSLSH